MTFSTPLALLLAIPLFALTIVIWQNGYVHLSPRRQKVALAVRLALLSAIILGLAGAGLRLSQSREAVVFVADLSASDVGSQSSMKSLINQALAQRPGDDVAGIVSVGRQPLVEQPVSALIGLDAFQSPVDQNYTNLEGGLELANAILTDGYRRRIVMMSDGQQNVGDALGITRLLRSQGVRVDVVPVHVPGGAEVLVDKVDVPSQLRPREHFSLAVTVRSTVETTTGLDIYRDRTLMGSVREPVHVGENRYVFAQAPLPPGSHAYQVQITPAMDTQPENNQGSAFTSVQGPPRVLVIAAARREAASVMASLRSTGIQTDLQSPVQVVPTLGYLQRYAGVVIVDTAADVLGTDLMSQLVPYVRDLGHGLVVIGGQESYGMGGYGQTPLEQALPVKMDLPKRKDLPSAAVALIIESLEEDTQINLSKEAGKGVVNLLTQQDQVAVNDTPFDGSAGWAVPLQHVTNKAAIDAQIAQMNPGDPQTYVPYLQAAFNVLKKTHARVKHIIVLGDGDAEDTSYEQVVRQIRAGGVTVSTVATNGLGMNDFQTMQDIARWGGGRYYQADDAAKIPKIFLREARTVARSGIIEGKFYPQELSANPMLRDIHGVAPLFGYVATTPKPTGEMVLVSQKLDPVLAGWQFGLGRSVAWTSDAAGLWTQRWLQAPGANRFWANLVSWTLPVTQGNHLFVATSSGQGQGQVAVDTPSALGANPTVTARILDPSLHTTDVQLQPSAPGHFRGSFQANAQGPYFVTVEARGAGHGEAGQAGLDVPYSAEYRTTGTNTPFLHAMAAAGGGSIMTQPQGAWLDNLSPVYAQRSLTAWLWLLALLLLPIDIGVRRLVMSRRDLVAVWNAVPFRRRQAAGGEPSIAPLGTLRARRARRSSSEPLPAGQIGARLSLNRSASEDRPSAPASPTPPEAPAAAATPQESTTSQLLAAKRRRR